MKKSILLALPALVVLLAQSSNADAQATTYSGSGRERVIVKTTDTTQSGSFFRWQNYLGTNLWSLGNDYFGNNGQNFFLFDLINGFTNLYIDNTGTSYLRMGPSAGSMEYDNTSAELRLSATNNKRVRLTSSALKISTAPYYQRRSSGTSTPSKGVDCDGGGAGFIPSESSDVRGYVRLGPGTETCTLTFAVPWDLSVNEGYPICTATTNKTGVTVAVTSLTDHEVTFTLNTHTSGSTYRIYYHCDGVLLPP